MTDSAVLALADRFNAALYAADLGTIDALLAPDFELWHNFSGKTYDRAAALDFLRLALPTSMRGLRYDNIRRLVMAQGYVEQHLASAFLASGVRNNGIEACLVVRLAGDRIVRIDEYLDSIELSEK
jgi:hypothetical protein